MWSKTFLRAASALAATLAAAMLAGCGGGGGAEVSDVVDAPPADLDTPDSVLMHVATTVLGRFVPAVERPTASGKSGAKALRSTLDDADVLPHRRGNSSNEAQKALVNCDGGGTSDIAEAVEREVDSPFTDETYLVVDVVNDECRYESDGYQESSDGFEAFGCPVSASGEGSRYPCELSEDIYYSTRGRVGEPYRLTSTRIAPDGTFIELSQATDKFEYHYKSSQPGVTESQFVSTSRGTMIFDGGPTIPFERSTGTSALPRQYRDAIFDGYGLYEMGGGYRLYSPGCDLGEYSVSTQEAVAYLRRDNLDNVATAGRIEVRNGERTAYLDFHGDGSFTATDAGGDSKTYRTVDAVREAMGSCLPFAY